MGAARLASVQANRDPVVRQYLIDHHAYQKQIQEIKDKAAAELDESRRNLTSQLVTTHRQLTASLTEVEALRNANHDLQVKLQEKDVELTHLRSVNVDLEKKVRACGNITRFLEEIARDEMRGER
jgi:hypothetical protein